MAHIDITHIVEHILYCPIVLYCTVEQRDVLVAVGATLLLLNLPIRLPDRTWSTQQIPFVIFTIYRAIRIEDR